MDELGWTLPPLLQYVKDHTDRNACTCGKCIISGEDKKLSGHTVDIFFFEVCVKDNPDVNTFKELIASHQGEYGECNPLDENEYSYIHLGGWLGSQEIALRFMALGKLLGLWDVMEPGRIGLSKDNPIAQQMAGAGLVTIVRNAKKTK